MDFLGQLRKAMEHLWKASNFLDVMVHPQGLPGGAQQELGRSHARGLLRDPLHGGADCHEPRMSIFPGETCGKPVENLKAHGKPYGKAGNWNWKI